MVQKCNIDKELTSLTQFSELYVIAQSIHYNHSLFHNENEVPCRVIVLL